MIAYRGLSTRVLMLARVLSWLTLLARSEAANVRGHGKAALAHFA
jgi:hypothetical protein